MLARDARLWRRLLRRELDVAYAAAAAPPSHWQRQFLATRAAPPAPLRFRGVFTDGGTDGPDGRYSVDALFSAYDFEAYCSARGSNVHTLALLDSADAAAAAAAPDAAQLQRRAYLLERCRVAGALMFGAPARRGPGRRAPGQQGFAPESDLQRWSKTELEAFFLQLCDLEEAGHPLGALMFAGCAAAARAAETARCTALAAEMRAQRAAAAEGPPGGGGASADVATERRAQHEIFLPLALPAADAPRALACVTAAAVSRVGQFSCPLACGALLLASLNLSADSGGEAEGQRALSSLVRGSAYAAALDDVASLEALLDASREGHLPRVTAVHHSAAGCWAEFAPRGSCQSEDNAARGASSASAAAQLWPVAWFAFATRAEAARRADADADAADAATAAAGSAHAPPAADESLPDEDRFDKMALSFAAPHSGNVCCVKLISSENLMNDWGDDHPEPNIDVNSVQLVGALVALPAGARA